MRPVLAIAATLAVLAAAGPPAHLLGITGPGFGTPTCLPDNGNATQPAGPEFTSGGIVQVYCNYR